MIFYYSQGGVDKLSLYQSRSAKAGLRFPVGCVHRLSKKGNYTQRESNEKLVTLEARPL